MEFHIRDNPPLIDVEHGIPTLIFWFSDYSDIDTMRDFANSIDVGQHEVTLDVGVPLSSIVDYTIENKRLGFHRGLTDGDPIRLDESDRPELEAIRAALLEAVAKIDCIEYVPYVTKKGANPNAA